MINLIIPQEWQKLTGKWAIRYTRKGKGEIYLLTE